MLESSFVSMLKSGAQWLSGRALLMKLRGRWFKVSKGAKIRNRYNQVPHLTQPHRRHCVVSL